MRDVNPQDANRQVETGGISESGTFQILANAKAFRLLIDGLYSDKIRAITRELWTNAYDSHCMAGKADVPFYCRLPTRFDPTFAVRDYGVSLTHEQVFGLYTTVFASTKEDSNTQVGKFGLGSKTPFAYGDAFTLTAVLDGEKRTYSAYLDGKGIPRISLFNREPTDEPQGFEVSFPVNEGDIQAFRTAAERVALGFDVVPNNNLGLTKPELTVAARGEGWVWVAKDYSLGISGPMVRQGCVIYPVDTSAMGAATHNASMVALSGEAVIIDMPIGSVDITPSREGLSYDTQTISNLVARFDIILADFVDTANKKIAAAPTLFEAIKLRLEVLAAVGSYALREQVARSTRWRGRNLPSSLEVRTRKLASIARHGQRIVRGLAERGSRNRHRRELVYGLGEPAASITLLGGETLTFLHWSGKDTPKHLKHRLAAALEGKSSYRHQIFLLPNWDPNSYAAKLLFVACGRPPADAYNMIDLDDIEFTLPTYDKVLAGLQNWSGWKFNSHNARTPDPEEVNVFWVPTFRCTAKIGETEIDNGTVQIVWDTLRTTNLIPHNSILVGIPASRKDLAKKVPEGWQPLWEHARALVEDTFDKVKARQVVANNILVENLTRQGKEWLRFSEIVKLDGWNIADPCSPFLASIEALSLITSPSKETSIHSTLFSLIPRLFTTEEAAAMQDLGDTGDKTREFWLHPLAIRKRYPMVEVLVTAKNSVRADWTLRNIAAAVSYIDLVDAATKDSAICTALDVSEVDFAEAA